MDQVLLILRALALCASFGGLCCLYQRAGINRYIAPAAAASSVIVALMLCGMGGFLSIGWNVLYVLGFIGLIDAHIVRRQRFDWRMLTLLIVFAAWLVWRFYGCYLSYSDDMAHWGIVARYLVEENAFPNAMASMIEFQTYPLGSAAFIYYIVHALKNSEGLYILAQHLLMGINFLPMLAFIKGNKRFLYPLLPIVYIVLFLRINVVSVAGLQVDWLLAFMGFGVIASVMYHRDNVKKALIAAVPMMLALVYIKSSGVFFSVCGLIALMFVAGKNGFGWKRVAGIAIGGAAALGIAYLLWTLHVKLAFPQGFSSKHAVSLTAYVAELSEKGVAVAGTIIRKMAMFLIKPGGHQLTAGLIYMAVTAVLAAGCFLLDGQRKYLRRVMGSMVAVSAVHFLWYVLLLLMYLFSMPAWEAVDLASIDRYTSTSLTCMMMLGCGVFFAFFGREDLQLSKAVRVLYCCTMAIAVIAVIIILPRTSIVEKLNVSEDELVPARQRLQSARQGLALEENSNVLVFCDGNVPEEKRPYYRTRRYVRYELYTNHITLLSTDIGGEVDDYVEITWAEGIKTLEDPMQYVREHIDAFDAFILLDCDEVFDRDMQEFLREYDGAVPVYRTY